MGRNLLGAFIGGLVLFFWGAISWTVLPLHEASVRTLPEEQLITDTLKTVVHEPGFYMFPSDKTSAGRMDQNVWTEKYKKGPVGSIIFSPQGKEPMAPSAFVINIIANLFIGWLVFLTLNASRDRVKGLVRRALLAVGFGLVAWLYIHLSQWNWLGFPTDFTIAALVDCIVPFALMGLLQAKLVHE